MAVPEDAKDTWLTVFKIDNIEINGLNLDVMPIPDGEFADKNTSTYQTGRYARFGKNQFDAGSVDISGIKIPGDAGQIALKNALGDTNKHTFQVILTELGVIFEYQALVMQFSPSSEDNTATFTGKLKASGKFIETTSYASVSKIEITTATVVIPATVETTFPASASDVVITELTGTATETIKVTAASATYIGYSVDNGYTWTELTTATMSGSIALGSAGTVTKIIVRIEEENKATRFVNLWIGRA